MAGNSDNPMLDYQSQFNQDKQDWGISPSKYREFEVERINSEREARRFREEMERAGREAEQRDERARRAETERNRNRINEGANFHRHIFESMKSTDNKSQKDLVVERLAIKFCFVRNRLSVWKTLAALGVIKNPFEKKNEPELLKKLFESIVADGSRNGISRKEISEAIMEMSAESAEGDVADNFVNNFLGLVALNVFKTNPNIIKDVKPKEKIPTIKSGTPNDGFGRRNLCTEDILRLIREINAERENRNNLFIQDYPDIFQCDNLGSSNISELRATDTWLQQIMGRWRD